MAVILTVPPYAAGQYGCVILRLTLTYPCTYSLMSMLLIFILSWDPLEKDCWYTNDNEAQRLAWQVRHPSLPNSAYYLG